MLKIRTMTAQDLPQVGRLSSQLRGKTIELESISKSFAALSKLPDHELLVAENEEQKIVGWVHIFPFPTLGSGVVAEVGGLVVDEAARGQGVGTKLMDHAEAWAKEKKFEKVRLGSQLFRTEAHQFYQKRGYQIIKHAYIFDKAL